MLYPPGRPLHTSASSEGTGFGGGHAGSLGPNNRRRRWARPFPETDGTGAKERVWEHDDGELPKPLEQKVA